MRKPFRFKHFNIIDTNCAMKVSTDAVLLGAWAEVGNVNRILDIGTGSGIIAVALAQRSTARIDAIDIHAPSCEDAGLNFSNCQWKERLKLYQLPFSDFIIQNEPEYDLVVCNPPYHSKSLKSPSENVNISRHTTTLSHKELVNGTKTILRPGGRFCVILPLTERQNFKQIAMDIGLHCRHECEVFPKTSKPANRVMIEFGLMRPSDIRTSQITIRNSSGTYNLSYIELTKDYYLNF